MYLTPKASASDSSLREKRMLTRLPTIAATAAARWPSPRSSGSGHARRADQDLGELRLGEVLGRVASHDVADLVPENTGQLSLVAQVLDETGCDEDLAPRKRERVDGLGIAQDVEGVPIFRSGRVAAGHDLLPNLRDRLLHGGVGQLAAELLLHLRRGGEPHGDLLLRRKGNVLLLSRYRIDLLSAVVQERSDYRDQEPEENVTSSHDSSPRTCGAKVRAIGSR